MTTDKDNLDNFDKFADDYSEIMKESLNFTGADHKYFAEYKIIKLKQLLENKSSTPAHILDFGCGSGTHLEFLRKYFQDAEIYGTDISEKSVRLAQSLNIENCQFEIFDGSNFPFPEQKFDIIISINVFHHIPHELHEETLKKMKNALSKNGKIIIIEHNPHNPMTRKFVNDCPLDKDAKLLYPSYLKGLVDKNINMQVKFTYTVFVPPKLKFLTFIEKYLTWLPIGAQYIATIE